MKISIRIIIINLTIVIIILSGVGTAFYTVMYNILNQQQSKQLIDASNEFVFNLQKIVQEIDNEVPFLIENPSKIKSTLFVKQSSVDFIIKIENDSIITNILYVSDKVVYDSNIKTIFDFIEVNKECYLKYYYSARDEFYLYGFLLTPPLLTKISERIKADIAIFSNGILESYSNEKINQSYLFNVIKAGEELSLKNNYDIFTEETSSAYFLATVFFFKEQSIPSRNIFAILFNTSDATLHLRKNIEYIIIISGLSGFLLSIILTLLFTSRLRKQIADFNFATNIVKFGDFHSRLQVKGKDELTDLAVAFNKMLDELERQEKFKTDYTEFITLIIQNPTLSEVCYAAINKISSTVNSSFSSIYIVNNDSVGRIVAINENLILDCDELLLDILKPKVDINELLIVTKSNREFNQMVAETDSNFIVVIVPIIYNAKIIAIMLLGFEHSVDTWVIEYLNKVRVQLAIGITNASFLKQMENLVRELKTLNDEYQKSNLQIKEQNEQLIKYQQSLMEKADELNRQKLHAESLTKAKAQFLALMSHELRTPLNAILGLTELVLEDRSLSNKVVERLKVVQRSGKRLLNLINDILTYSKIEAGKMELNFENFLVEELVEEIKTNLAPLAAEKKLKFKVRHPAGNKFYLRTDKVKLNQILINLVANAIRFTEKGFVEIKYSKTDEGWLKFDVIDSGIGISIDDQKIIFDEFTQADSSTTRKYGGTGLGLSICKKFIEMLDGNISLKSEINKGTTFTVQIPVLFLEQNLRLYHQPTDETGTDDSINSEPINKEILIVDDDPNNLFMINEILTQEGFTTLIAKNGKECLEILSNSSPAIILLDIMMPVMDGFQTIQKIRQMKSKRYVYVFAMTAKIISDSENIMKKYGFDGYISKPVDFQKLKTQIQSIIKIKSEQ